MATNEQMNEFEKLLTKQYGLTLADLDQDPIERDLDEGEDPQAILDDLAEKFKMERIDGDDNSNWFGLN